MTDQNAKFMRSSFADKLRAGWSKEALLKYYCLSEVKYERILASLKNIEEYVEK